MGQGAGDRRPGSVGGSCRAEVSTTAIWSLAVAYTTARGSEPDSSPLATVQRIGVDGGHPGGVTQDYASFAKALGQLMEDGWEPFCAHLWEDFAASGQPMQEIESLPIRDYVWFRKAVNYPAETVADAPMPKP